MKNQYLSKVDYFDIKDDMEVEIVEFVKAHIDQRKDGIDIEQKLDIYKVVVPNGNGKIHYLYAHEIGACGVFCSSMKA